MSDPVVREFLLAFWKIHILSHAEEGGVHGHWMVEELHRHGYRISPGSLYPMLHGLEKKGYLLSTGERHGKSLRKVYRATALGKRALALAKRHVMELLREIMPEELGR